MSRSYGVVEPDETRVARITLRFPGRVEELMVNAVGMEVKKGDPLAKVYSPKFLAAAQEYVQALEAQRKAEADPQAGAGGEAAWRPAWRQARASGWRWRVSPPSNSRRWSEAKSPATA